MIVPLQVQRRYEIDQAHVEFVASRVGECVAGYCGTTGFAFASRLKSLESLSEKIETGRFSQWNEITDLFGCTIVIPTLREEPEVLDFLNHTFARIEVRLRGSSKKAPEVFRFDATRFVGTIRTPPGVDSHNPVHGIPFEVQIRSAFEHAWSVTTHQLVYKSKQVDWKRLRIAAQLKAAVEQLDSLVLAFDESARLVQPNSWPEVECRSTVTERFSNWVACGKLPPELAPQDWSRFAESFVGLLRASMRGSSRRPDALANFTERAILAIQEELEQTLPHDVPRSLSLFQFSLGVLAKRDVVGNELPDFYPLITPELLLLFPETERLSSRFHL